MIAIAAALGGHLGHVLLSAGWLLAFGLALLGSRLRRRRAPAARPQAAASREAADSRPAAASREAADSRPAAASRGLTARSSGALQLAALGLCAAAATHLAVTPAHFRQSWMYGCFFLVAASGQLTAAALLLTRPSRPVLTAALAGSLTIVAVWVVSRVVGVPLGPDNGATEAVGVLDVLASVAELTTVLGCAVALARRPALSPAWRWSAWSLALRLLLAVTTIGVPVAAVLAPRA